LTTVRANASSPGPLVLRADVVDPLPGTGFLPLETGATGQSSQDATAQLPTSVFFIRLQMLWAQIAHFVDHYNHFRYHESLQNLTPADVYFGRGQTILLERERIQRDKTATIATSLESRLNSNPRGARASVPI
jgi:hypothetical protein